MNRGGNEICLTITITAFEVGADARCTGAEFVAETLTYTSPIQGNLVRRKCMCDL
jgi:hypothetical protein